MFARLLATTGDRGPQRGSPHRSLRSQSATGAASVVCAPARLLLLCLLVLVALTLSCVVATVEDIDVIGENDDVKGEEGPNLGGKVLGEGEDTQEAGGNVAEVGLDTGSTSSGSSDVQEENNKRKILVFGGNGLLGASTVERLVMRGYDVTIVNRGNWYWDSASRVRPFVHSITCDRKQNITTCSQLIQRLQRLGNNNSFEAVLDFSAYQPVDIRDATRLLKGKANLYLEISTDSVYDVTDQSTCRGVRGCVEEDTRRPDDSYTRDLLSRHHDYGNHKLEAEEELIMQRKDGEENITGIPYVILRLPDVLGPRDTTYRFWIYQLWIKLSGLMPQNPVTIPKFLVNYNNSFVYVEDVAKIIVDVILTSTSPDIKDQVYNLAWADNITLEMLLKEIAKGALSAEEKKGVEKAEEEEGEAKEVGTVPFTPTILNDTKGSTYLYPSVRRGPVDCSKAEKLLGWSPTPWRQAIYETVQFYERAMVDEKYIVQREEIIQIVAGQLFSDDQQAFYKALENIYHIDLKHYRAHDEL